MITCGGCPHPQTIHDRDSGDCAVPRCGCCWRPPTREYLILLAQDLDALGVEMVVCAGCRRDLYPGDPYQDRLLAMTDQGEAVSEAVCVYCTLTSG